MGSRSKNENTNQAATGKKRNAFVRFMHNVFVKNIGYKLLALILGAAIAVLYVGLS